MDVEVRDLNGGKKAIKVEVPPERVDEEFDAVFNRLSKRAKIPGFRKGKVPRNIVEAHLGGAVAEEVVHKLVGEACEEVFKEKGIEPMSQPAVKLKDKEPTRGAPFSFEVTLLAKPEIRLGDYKGVKVERKSVSINEEEIEKIVAARKTQMVELTPVEGRSAKEGDWVLLDYAVSTGSIPLDGGRDYLVNIGGGVLPSTVEKALVGCSVGTVREVREGDVVFNVEVKAIKERRRLVVDGALASNSGGLELESKLREQVKAELETRVARDAELDVRKRVVEKVIDAAEAEVPAALVEKQTDHLVSIAKERPAPEGSPSGKESLDREKYRDIALRQIKEDLVLEAVTKREGIEVTDSEVEDEVRQQGALFSKEVRKYWSSEEGRDDIKFKLRRKKVVDFLVRHADISGSLVLRPDQANLVVSGNEDSLKGGRRRWRLNR